MNSNIVVEAHINDALKQIANHQQSDVFVLMGPLVFGVDDYVKKLTESIPGKKKKKLLVLLETSGGLVETTERIANLFRNHYPESVQFLIPNYAFSAGTILAMSGDEILMDYHSVLGPIDPQIERRDGKGLMPASGYLIKYDSLIEKARDPKEPFSQAELHYLIQHFNPAELYQYEQARELSIALLVEWLVKYKFKDWQKAKSQKSRRAKMIAKRLSDTDLWKSHGRGISMDVLRNSLKLRITDFGNDKYLDNYVKKYYYLLKDYLSKREVRSVLHSNEQFIFFN